MLDAASLGVPWHDPLDQSYEKLEEVSSHIIGRIYLLSATTMQNLASESPTRSKYNKMQLTNACEH